MRTSGQSNQFHFETEGCLFIQNLFSFTIYKGCMIMIDKQVNETTLFVTEPDSSLSSSLQQDRSLYHFVSMI